MRKLFLIHFGTICVIILLNGCNNSSVSQSAQDITFKPSQLEYRDSLYTVYTLKGWQKKSWQGFATLIQFFKIDSSEINYLVPAIFYSPDKKKIIVWYGQKFPNAMSRTGSNRVYSGDLDTLYYASALIGYRGDVNSMWHLYPLDNEQANNSPSLKVAVTVLYQYYCRTMKKHSMYCITQSGINKGDKELKTYGYNIQDTEFWNKCWIWDRDTVGSHGLFNFQIEAYDYDGNKCTPDCANPYNPPVVNYPDEVLRLYN